MFLKSLPFLLLNCIGFFVNAQDQSRVILNGFVKSVNLDLEGIYVINIDTEKQVMTDAKGKFSIAVRIGDTLLFSYYKCEAEKIVVSLNNFNKQVFFYRKKPIITQLDEVVIKQYKNINAIDLGIVKAGIKHFTPAQRRLKTATSSLVDGLINTISGRKKTLKQELEIEKKETALLELKKIFSDKFMIEQLKIDSLYVKGFQYFVIENQRFIKTLFLKNKTEMEFLLTQLAKTYKDLNLPKIE